MIFKRTPLEGACLIEIEKRVDDRGYFARAFCQDEFRAQGLNPSIAQINLSCSLRRGTLRGMHCQVPPKAETKVVSCTQGALWDVIVDLRAASPTYLQHFSIQLRAADRTALYIPAGFAHGFLTLEEETSALYFHSEFYAPDCELGIRFDDPALKIQWPFDPIVISAKDRAHPAFDPGNPVGF
jgi:dTDP-4-dehydrorhamnose 3,5-epimerase